MTNEKFEREKTYQIMLHIAITMLRKGLLTKDEMHIIVTILKEKYAPLLGCLYP